MNLLNQSESSFKNRVLLVAFLLTFVFIFIFVTLIYMVEKNNLENTKREFQAALGNSIEQIIGSTVDTYSLLAKTILETTKAKELIKAEKREELYSLIESKWKTWSSENPEFKIMLFHRADGTVFLRMHKPEVYDDYLSDIRPMVKAAHEQKRVLIGYETGKYSTVFRILTPIFYQGEYLGSLDFGINPNYIVDKIKKFKQYNGVLFIKDENLKLFKHKSTFEINDYSLQSKIDTKTEKLLKSLPPSYSFKKEENIQIEDTYHSTYTYSVKDYRNLEKAQMLFFYDNTDTIDSQKLFIATLAITSIVFIILMFFLLNNSFNRLLKTLTELYNEYSLDIQKKEADKNRQTQHYLDVAQVLIMALDNNRNVIMINQKGADILGYSKEEIVGKNWMENFLPKRIKADIIKLSDDVTNKRGDYEENENHILTKSGEERLLLWKNTPLLDDEGNSIGILTSGEDITVKREQEKKLLQQSRMAQMGEMISMIAHQWRQPLSSISAIAGTLSLDVMMDEYKKEFFAERLDSIAELSQHLSSTIDDFRNFYKPNKEAVNTTLEELITRAIKIMKSSLDSDNIEMLYEYNDKQMIKLYENETIQVVLNILKNAQDNFKEKKIENPQIKITTKENCISICDNGGGIPEDILPKIFDPYYSTKDEKNGTGLGLYMSKTIVEEHHNGKLQVSNRDDGVCFTIELYLGDNIAEI